MASCTADTTGDSPSAYNQRQSPFNGGGWRFLVGWFGPENCFSCLPGEYPNQPELMVYLARALLARKTEDSAREALVLCRAADGREMRLSSTFGCKQVMALALHRLGQAEQAAQLVEDEMPAIFVSRELLLPKVAPPERAARIRRSNVTLLTDLLTSTLDRLGREEPAFAQAAEAIRHATENLM